MNGLDKSEKNTPDDFVFSAYFLPPKDAWEGCIVYCDFATLPYGFIGDPLGLYNNKEELIICLKDQVGRVKNRIADANQKIRDRCNGSRAEESIVTDFEKMVVPRLQKSKTEQIHVDTPLVDKCLMLQLLSRSSLPMLPWHQLFLSRYQLVPAS